MFESSRNQLVAEPRIRRAPVAIDGKRNDGELVVTLTDLRLQEIPIGALLGVRHSDHDALYTRKFLVIRRPNLHIAIKPRTKQPHYP
jgi:hypothetical protein